MFQMIFVILVVTTVVGALHWHNMRRAHRSFHQFPIQHYSDLLTAERTATQAYIKSATCQSLLILVFCTMHLDTHVYVAAVIVYTGIPLYFMHLAGYKPWRFAGFLTVLNSTAILSEMFK